MNLDENQRKAVEHFKGPALVVAGPGSGKTTVIIERIKHLIQKHRVGPTNILAIAFTNTAVNKMKERLKDISIQENIYTLHVFGKKIVLKNHHQLEFPFKPENTWDEKYVADTIKFVKEEHDRQVRNENVTIYRMYDPFTGRCYIGQTINPDRRKEEHFTCSSNEMLREAIQRGEVFFFEKIETVKSKNANSREKYWIDHYRDKSIKKIDIKLVSNSIDNEVYYSIIKIKSRIDTICWIGMSPVPENEYIDYLKNNIDKETINEIETGFLETLYVDLFIDEAEEAIEYEIEKHQAEAVFNRANPVMSQYSEQIQIEVFSEFFKIPYTEVINKTHEVHTQIKEYDELKDKLFKIKSQVISGLFNPDRISDPVLRGFAMKYEEKKKEAYALDFNDMLINSAYLLENNIDLLTHYQKEYQYVLVDEFQDISPLDWRLIRLFSENLFAVGDDDQAIYGFRGGDSDIMRNFSTDQDVKNFEVTCNYRSTSTIVRHARALIENNPQEQRISKRLSAENRSGSRLDVTKLESISISKHILPELLPIITTCEWNFQLDIPYITFPLFQELSSPIKIGILARNNYEIEPIKTGLYKELYIYGFKRKKSDSDNKKKEEFILERGPKEIEISTIHSAKGKEWDKVFILVNTKMSQNEPSIPDSRNSTIDERKLFYVAVTRARFDLVVFDSGKCQFTNELQKIPLSDQKEELLEEKNRLISAYRKKVDNAKNELLSITKTFLNKIESNRPQLRNIAIQHHRNQNTVKLQRIQSNITHLQESKRRLTDEFNQKGKTVNHNFILKLIPILGELHSNVYFSEEDIENYYQSDLSSCVENINSTYKQFSKFLHSYGIVPIETKEIEFNPDIHSIIRHDFSDLVPKNMVIKEVRRGYMFNNIVIQKAQVIVSKGEILDNWRNNLNLRQPICYVTKNRILEIKNIRKIQGMFYGINKLGLAQSIRENAIMFAYSKSDLDILKTHKLKVNDVPKQNSISDDFLRSLPDNAELRFVITDSYVLTGHILEVGQKVIHACINGKSVIIYRKSIIDIYPGTEFRNKFDTILSNEDKSENQNRPIVNNQKGKVEQTSSSIFKKK